MAKSKKTDRLSAKELQQFMNKVKKMEKGHQLDLSSDEDLSIGIMNLISIEEHFFFTYAKTNDKTHLDLLSEVREMRKTLLKRIIKDYEGEVWCISKHLLAASMRMMEVGTKALTKGDKKDASDFFDKSFKLYSLFWGLNLGAVKVEDVAQEDSDDIELIGEGDEGDDSPGEVQKKMSIFDKMGELVKKAIDCCKE